PRRPCGHHPHRAEPMRFRADPDGEQFFALRTFRADGSPVTTPVWLTEAGGRWYCYTPGRSWKVRRIKKDRRVEVARSDYHGSPYGAWVTGKARVLQGEELRRSRRALAGKYGAKFRLLAVFMVLGRFRRHMGPAVGLELILD